MKLKSHLIIPAVFTANCCNTFKSTLFYPGYIEFNGSIRKKLNTTIKFGHYLIVVLFCLVKLARMEQYFIATPTFDKLFSVSDILYGSNTCVAKSVYAQRPYFMFLILADLFFKIGYVSIRSYGVHTHINVVLLW